MGTAWSHDGKVKIQYPYYLNIDQHINVLSFCFIRLLRLEVCVCACVTWVAMSCCSGSHASSPFDARRRPSLPCSVGPGVKPHRTSESCCCRRPSMTTPLCLQRHCLPPLQGLVPPPPPPLPPPLPAARDGDSCQVMEPTRYPHTLAPGWASSRSPVWLHGPLVDERYWARRRT